MDIKQLVIPLYLSVLSACATAANEPDDGAYAATDRGSDCIMSSTVRDYQVLDDSNLVVTASGRRVYHIQLSRRVSGLRSSWKIGFASRTTSRVCAGFGEVIVDDSFGPEAVRIADIRELTPDEHEELLIRFGKKEPEIEMTAEPEDVEGAEVEGLD